ncbi:DUF6233 domain-containing protein [Streptomyces albireticuli]|uniref:Uncharacterized protein n=1 Tax=Streptomyces albireticuli TaxID=1940 RepID=A0A2A2D3X4_9ACTN|nr:DUF6233 domain-containing protein [Streptomyces albireticuli]MCD9196092.1 DUF6233 domain-containing protein [Streptomyces albireticuli]PAU46157.1 hypothetical protein CK936_25510 [Streptomyces albireticuli]
MNDLPPDLPRLTVLETYLDLQLRAVRRSIAELQHPPVSPAAEAWTLERIRTDPQRPLGRLHRSTCHLSSGPTLNRMEARLALREPGIEPCTGCLPEEGLRE